MGERGFIPGTLVLHHQHGEAALEGHGTNSPQQKRCPRVPDSVLNKVINKVINKVMDQ